MKIFAFCIFAIAVLTLNVFSQNPGFTRTDPEWVLFLPDSVEAKSHAMVNNPYGAAETLRVVRTFIQVPANWEGVGICDINLCYGVGTDTAIALYPPGNSEIYIYFSKLPGLTGSSVTKWKVERVSNPSLQSPEVAFSVTSGPIGITQLSTTVSSFSLSQNYPNPFNPNTKINFSIPRSEFVSLRVYDMLGREVKVIANSLMSPGEYEADFDAKGLSSGMYYYSLRAGDFVDVKKMVLVK